MKNIRKHLTCHLLFLFPAIVYAQQALPVVKKDLPEITFGLKAGFNPKNFNSYPDQTISGLMAGIYANLKMGNFGLRTEPALDFLSISSGKLTPTPTYIDLPVLAEYKILKRTWLQAGPQFSVYLNTYNGNGTYLKSYLSGNIGVETKLASVFNIGLRYNKGLTNAYDMSIYNSAGTLTRSESFSNNSIQFYVVIRVY